MDAAPHNVFRAKHFGVGLLEALYAAIMGVFPPACFENLDQLAGWSLKKPLNKFFGLLSAYVREAVSDGYVPAPLRNFYTHMKMVEVFATALQAFRVSNVEVKSVILNLLLTAQENALLKARKFSTGVEGVSRRAVIESIYAENPSMVISSIDPLVSHPSNARIVTANLGTDVFDGCAQAVLSLDICCMSLGQRPTDMTFLPASEKYPGRFVLAGKPHDATVPKAEGFQAIEKTIKTCRLLVSYEPATAAHELNRVRDFVKKALKQTTDTMSVGTIFGVRNSVVKLVVMLGAALAAPAKAHAHFAKPIQSFYQSGEDTQDKLEGPMQLFAHEDMREAYVDHLWEVMENDELITSDVSMERSIAVLMCVLLDSRVLHCS